MLNSADSQNTQSTQAEPNHIQDLIAIVGAPALKSNIAVTSLKWLLYDVALLAPVVPTKPDDPVRGKESKDEWKAIWANHKAELNKYELALQDHERAVTTFKQLISLVVKHASALFPTVSGIFGIAERFAIQVAESTLTKDPRRIERCQLCNQDVKPTDARRQCIESTRFVAIHSHCPGDKVTRIKHLLSVQGLQPHQRIIPEVKHVSANRRAF